MGCAQRARGGSMSSSFTAHDAKGASVIIYWDVDSVEPRAANPQFFLGNHAAVRRLSKDLYQVCETEEVLVTEDPQAP
jgi:hypothetical protein